LRNDPVLHKNYFYWWPYWDEDIRKSVEVVEFIDFKKPRHQMHDSRKDLERARKGGHIK
jgi:hypothetical protein